ncbi:MAG: putative gamma-glutamyltranspeptidase, partial [Rhodospirillales bacterium]|nr:putative gamma-glutamyltranspeptidase [Rhodospirillales bacterium]
MFTTRPELRGTFGAVASTHWLASSVGMSFLERGGNAFDAAVATAFVLQVVEPHLNGPAGEVPILLWSRKSGRVETICGQGVAPAAATIARYRELGIDDLVPGTGLLATVVPGAFDAWMLLLRDYGTMRPADILAPAIAYAVNGYPLVPQIAATIATVQDLFLSEWKTSAAVYLPGGALPRPGMLFRNKQLGAMYQRVSDEAVSAGGDRDAQIEAARRAWSRGFVADTIDRFCRTAEVMDVSGRRHRGLLTGDDMARWRATIEAPATYDYHGYTIAKTGPWGQGPVLLQQLALLRDIDLAAMDPTGAEFVHAVVESAKLAFADREAWYGDPDVVDVPLATLLSEDYSAARRTLIGSTASLELRPGTPDGRVPRLPDLSAVSAAAGAGIGEPTMRRDGEAVVTADGA